MKIRNLKGPSGVPLGGCGVGYYEIDPRGSVTRSCIGNIHQSFVDTPAGFLVAVHDGARAVRLMRDDETRYGMTAYTDSDYTDLWPTMRLDLSASPIGAANMGYTAFSGASAHNILHSALPAVFYEISLVNPDDCDKTMTALLTWGDLIGRGLRDTDKAVPSNPDGESADWYDKPTPETHARGVTLETATGRAIGVMQYADAPILPHKPTFQNYNKEFLLLAEAEEGVSVTIRKSFAVTDENALDAFRQNGCLDTYDEEAVALSDADDTNTRTVQAASAVAASVVVPAHGTKSVHFLVAWFMPAITDKQLASMNGMPGCDYNKYYHNYFDNITSLAAYALENRAVLRAEIDAWQTPLCESTLPDWLIWKQINSGYTLYTNGVLNQRGNYSSLEGGMGGYGGTMDQKMSSHPFYAKLFPMLNRRENRQFANVRGRNGEIQHFDVHYYHGIADDHPDNRVNPTPAGSMIDNAGAWMFQLWNDYKETGDMGDMTRYYEEMVTSMDFIRGKYAPGTHIPNYNTTYDDYAHPPILSFSATVWLLMLSIAADWAALLGDEARAAAWRREYALTALDTDKLYVSGKAALGYDGYYAFGSDENYIASDKADGEIKSEILFSGAMAGEFLSRYSGRGDTIPHPQFVAHMSTFLRTSIGKSRGYYAPKVYNIRAEQGLDNGGSRCWPFYLDSYGAMAAIQAGYLADGLAVLEATQRVHCDLGYMWTQSLWNPAYLTYMTAPVAWFIGDVLAGAAVDVPNRTLTLGPVSPEDMDIGDTLVVPLYYPTVWMTLTYAPTKKQLTLAVTKIFYREDEEPIVFDTVLACPIGMASKDGTRISLSTPFCAVESAVLDLSAWVESFRGVTRDKLLTPVEPYEAPKASRLANGGGLHMTVETENGRTESCAESVDFRWNRENTPVSCVTDRFTVHLAGRILPRYGQKYQLLFEYTGDADALSVHFDGLTPSVADTVDAVESQQFSPTEGCRLLVCTVELEADRFYDLTVTYRGDLAHGDNVLRFLWWSTTQNMGLVIKERMYPPMRFGEWIDALDTIDATCRAEGSHMAYTTKNSYALYSGLDCGSEEISACRFEMLAGASAGDVARGGIFAIHLDSPDGALLGSVDYTPRGSWVEFYPETTILTFPHPVSGKQNLCFVFHPVSDFLLNYEKFRLLPLADDEN